MADGAEAVLGSWVGPWHSVYGWFPTKEPTTKVVGYFAGLTLADTEQGVHISSRRERAGRMLVSKQVPGVGMLQIMNGAEAVNLLPAWTGARVRVGEAWRKSATEPENYEHAHYVVASASAVGVVYADPSYPDLHSAASLAGVTDEEQVVRSFLEDLVQLSWGR